MTNEELLSYFNDNKIAGNNIIDINYILEEIELEQAQFLVDVYHSDTMIYLPKSEITFFEWLKINDYAIWKDLWENSEIPPYAVAISFLPQLLQKDRGYIICDLLDNDNFYFSEKNIIEKNTKLILESIKERFLNKEKLTIAQLLLLEMSLSPIDIWHFAYKYSLNIEIAKKAVLELLQDKLINHWTKAEEIADII